MYQIRKSYQLRGWFVALHHLNLWPLDHHVYFCFVHLILASSFAFFSSLDRWPSAARFVSGSLRSLHFFACPYDQHPRPRPGRRRRSPHRPATPRASRYCHLRVAPGPGCLSVSPLTAVAAEMSLSSRRAGAGAGTERRRKGATTWFSCCWGEVALGFTRLVLPSICVSTTIWISCLLVLNHFALCLI